MGKWRTWDRNPCEAHRDFTYLAYDEKVIWESRDVLRYRLTSFLNEIDAKAETEEEKRKAILAYMDFEKEAIEINRATWNKIAVLEEKIKLLQESGRKKIEELGQRKARSFVSGE